MSQAGPLATITIALSALLGVLTGGIISDRWVQHNLRGRIYTSAAGLMLTIPAVILLGYGNGFLAIWSGALFFGFGFGMFDANSMPILCQFVSPRHRATGYGLMNMAGISAGAIVTTFLGKSADAGNLRVDMAFLAIFVVAALILQLSFLRPSTGNMND